MAPREMESVRQPVEIDIILQRLERLERENRRWKGLVSVTAVICSCVLLLGATNGGEPRVADELRARSVVLVDQNGMTLAQLGQLPHGALGLGFYDEGRKARLLLSVDANGESSMSVYGRDGRGSAVVMVGKEGETSLRLLDTQWRIRAALATWPDGSPFLHLSDRDGNERALLTQSDRSILPNGEIVRQPNSSLVLFDAAGAVRWRAP